MVCFYMFNTLLSSMYFVLNDSRAGWTRYRTTTQRRTTPRWHTLCLFDWRAPLFASRNPITTSPDVPHTMNQKLMSTMSARRFMTLQTAGYVVALFFYMFSLYWRVCRTLVTYKIELKCIKSDFKTCWNQKTFLKFFFRFTLCLTAWPGSVYGTKNTQSALNLGGRMTSCRKQRVTGVKPVRAWIHGMEELRKEQIHLRPAETWPSICLGGLGGRRKSGSSAFFQLPNSRYL